MKLLALALSLCAPIAALPAQKNQTVDLEPLEAPINSPFSIHKSCNVTEQRQIATGLQEAVALAAHAKEHILRWGNESEIYRKYFGDRPSITALGSFEVVLNENDNILFRCDDPDNNCRLDGWAGHWRGENGTDETVICELSYNTRRPLTTMCSQGYTVSGSETTTFWAADLLHRLYHMPAIGQGFVEHYADGYEGVLELAKSNSSESLHDSETLQYFALEAYAYDVAAPGVGCVGETPEEEEEEEEEEADIPDNCHTHEGGELHCV
ncbi:putative peptidase domain-containing protein [Aspergillus egyptiacus]|nr:putative peptidase domain-containing protein [Aspergillus egyptiacus]